MANMIYWLICVPFVFLGLCAIAAVIMGGRAERLVERQLNSKIQSPLSAPETAFHSPSHSLDARQHRFRASG